MGTEAERQDTRKAVIFDLYTMLDENAKNKSTYTVDELKAILSEYVKTASEK